MIIDSPTNNTYQPPDPEHLPESLHPARDAVLAARQRWIATDNAADTARRAADAADADHQQRLHAAAMAGDETKVADKRAALAAEATAAAEVAAVCKDVIITRWAELIAGIVDARADIAVVADQRLDQAQDDAIAAMQSYLDARHNLNIEYGFSRWLSTRNKRGRMGGPPSAGGPRAMDREQTGWVDRTGRSRAIDTRDLVAAMQIDARAADALRALEAREKALEARRTGDRQAQQTHVPPGKIVVS